jgi:hypothetical protein
MMKNNKKLKTALIVFIVILALVLCFNVGVYAAYALAATEVSYTKPGTSTTISVKAALDEVYAKVPSHEIGDEVTVGGEQFYVLEWDNNCDTVNLISKYNLNKAGTAQQDATYGTTGCAFSSKNYWGSSSNINLNDFIGCTETDAIGKAKSYGRSKGAISSRLLSYEEVDKLETKTNSISIYKMLYGRKPYGEGNYLRFWLGSASRIKNNVWIVAKDYGGIRPVEYYNESNFGVRPVITVLKSKIS